MKTIENGTARMNMRTNMGPSLLFIILWCLILIKQSRADAQCTAVNSSPVQLSVNSRRNHTGHWITQVGLQQSAGLESRATLVDVKHSSSSCGGTKSTLNLDLTFTAPPPRVGGDYELFAGLGYYKFHNEAVTFAAARQACAEEGAHVAVINSDLEAKVMQTLFSRFEVIVGTTKDWTWIGIQRIGDDHYSIFGDPLADTGYPKWCPGEPNRGTEYCVTFTKTGNGCFVDIICAHKTTFICEQPI